MLRVHKLECLSQPSLIFVSEARWSLTHTGKLWLYVLILDEDGKVPLDIYSSLMSRAIMNEKILILFVNNVPGA